jgi:WD40 repeat protein
MKLYFYDVNAKKQVMVIEGGSPFTAIDFAHDGFSILVGDARGNLYEYDLRNTAEPLSSLKSGHEKEVTCVRFPTNETPHVAIPTSTMANRPQATTKTPQDAVQTPHEAPVRSLSSLRQKSLSYRYFL